MRHYDDLHRLAQVVSGDRHHRRTQVVVSRRPSLSPAQTRIGGGYKVDVLVVPISVIRICRLARSDLGRSIRRIPSGAINSDRMFGRIHPVYFCLIRRYGVSHLAVSIC
jgi:hypothetical protein